jgi:hypothetical protein
MRAHDRFEALAGALLLNEATPGERAEFEAHAQSCARCGSDAASFGMPLRTWVEEAGAHETWRPSVAGDVNRRIADSRQKRWRFTLGTLGYAVAASLAINVAFVTGFAGRAIDALRVVPDYRYSATQPITIERRPPVVAAAPQPFNFTIVRSRSHEAKVRVGRPERAPSAQEKAADAAAAEAIHGLAIWNDGEPAGRDVAQVDSRCATAADAVFNGDEPCPLPTESR